MDTCRIISQVITKKRSLDLGIAAAISVLLIDGLFSQNLRSIAVSSVLWLCIGFAGIDERRNTLSHIAFVQLTRYKLIGLVLLVLLPLLPISMTTRLLWADTYLKKGYERAFDPTAAVTWYQKAARFNPQSEYILYALAATYRRLENYDEAIRRLMALQRVHPHFWLANFELGMAFWEQGKLKQARESFERQIALQNMHWRSYYYLAQIAYKTGYPEQASHYIEEIRRIHTIHPLEDEHLAKVEQLVSKYRSKQRDIIGDKTGQEL